MKPFLICFLTLCLMLTGCAGKQTGSPNQALNTVAAVATTAPALAAQLDSVYAYLAEQKAVPDHRDLATMALQKLDEVAPVIKAGAEALSEPGQTSWAQAALQLALVTAQALGYILPLVS